MSYARYAAVQASVEGPREREIRAFATVTRALTEAEAYTRAAPDYAAKRMSALHKNIRLWALLQADLLHDGNALPAQLKALLISLAIFAQKRSNAAMTDDSSLRSLIDLNQDMAEALAAQRQAHRAVPAVLGQGTATAA